MVKGTPFNSCAESTADASIIANSKACALFVLKYAYETFAMYEMI